MALKHAVLKEQGVTRSRGPAGGWPGVKQRIKWDLYIFFCSLCAPQVDVSCPSVECGVSSFHPCIASFCGWKWGSSTSSFLLTCSREEEVMSLYSLSPRVELQSEKRLLSFMSPRKARRVVIMQIKVVCNTISGCTPEVITVLAFQWELPTWRASCNRVWDYL